MRRNIFTSCDGATSFSRLVLMPVLMNIVVKAIIIIYVHNLLVVSLYISDVR